MKKWNKTLKIMNEQEKICACPEWWIFNNLWFSVILCTIFSKSNGPGGLWRALLLKLCRFFISFWPLRASADIERDRCGESPEVACRLLPDALETWIKIYLQTRRREISWLHVKGHACNKQQAAWRTIQIIHNMAEAKTGVESWTQEGIIKSR